MFPAISNINALNVFDLRKAKAAEGASTQPAANPFVKQAVGFAAYNANHPRHADSEGLQGVSHLANRLDILS